MRFCFDRQDVLFPYARDNVRAFLEKSWGTDQCQEDVKALRNQVYYIEFYCIVCSIYQTGLFVMCMVNEVKILFRLYMYQSKILLVILLIVSCTTCLTEVQRIWY